jgi:methionine-rich copper-binding protein CopC
MRSAALAALLTVTWASAAAAHVELISSSPAAGANLSTPPTQVTITFDDELNPDLSSFAVTGPGSTDVGTGEVDLTVADRNVLTGQVAITVPGVYTVTYAVAGVDGHQVHGSFSFGYQATTAIPDPTSDEHPDTAMAPPQRDTRLLVLAVVLLIAASLVVLRRMETR